MTVRVHVVECESGRPKGLELRSDFRADLLSNGRPRSDGEPEARKIVAQPAGRWTGLHDKVWNGLGRQNWPVVD
jgi:hypothetical protein